MTNRYLLPLFAGVSLFIATLTSCKKEKIDDTDQGFPIQLTAEKPGRNIVLNWTETKVSNFEHYSIVRSPNPIPDSPTPQTGSIATIDDYKTATFEDASFPLSEFVYYKVYAKIGDHFLFSPTVKITNNVQLLDLIANRTVFDTDNHFAYLFDGNKNSLFKYDYVAEKIVDTLHMPGVFDVRLAVGNHGDGNELYIAKNNEFDIDIYNADNLAYKTNIVVNGFVYSIASGNNDLLYVSSDNWSNNFAVYKRSTKQLKDGDSTFGGGGDTVLKVLSGDGLEVVSVGFSVIQKFKVSAQGIISDMQYTGLSGGFFGFIQSIAASDDGQFFIPEVIGSIFNNELELQGSLSGNSFIAFSDFAFSAGGDKIWAVQSNPGEIQEFSFPDISLTKRTPLNYQPFQAVRDGGDLIIVGFGTDGVSFTKTIVDKIKVE